MINERIALVMLEGQIPLIKGIDPHYTRRFYNSIQTFTQTSMILCESGCVKKFEAHLKVATRLFNEGNETVKNGVANVYLYSICTLLDQKREVRDLIENLLPKNLKNEMHHLHMSSGI